MSAKDLMRNAIRELMAVAVNEQFKTSLERVAATGDSGGPERPQNQAPRLGRLCFAFAVGACPAELLLNTKFSVGPCRWLHDGALAKSVPAHEISRVELRALRVIDNALEDVDHEDRKQRKALLRLSDVRASIEKHDLALEEAIRKLAKKADSIAENGRCLRKRGLIQASQKAMQEARKLEQSRLAIEDRLNRRRSGREQRLRSLPERLPLQECQTCGLSYGLDGKNSRHHLHLNGRLHRNIVLLREASCALRAKYQIQSIKPVSCIGDVGDVDTISAKRSKLDLASTLREDFEREETLFSDCDDFDDC
ncbi:putative RNA-binding protein Luc7-like 1 [Varroa destructor]|uniref:Uncharacterized protein n=1 Tax=Varroa destructor TaxID=109461 RepID=A0A7M7JMP2_VARDE|nr:putative RNA-binding protein Luc7-like 1 [Varroa destructor]